MTAKISDEDMENISEMISALSRSFSIRFPFLEYDDLVQEGWRFFYRKKLNSAYKKSKAKATTWIFSVLRNYYTDIVRRERRGLCEKLNEKFNDHHDFVNEGAMPSESCSARDLMAAFQHRLSPLCWEMLECLIDHVDVRAIWKEEGVHVSHRSYCCLMDELRSTTSHVVMR